MQLAISVLLPAYNAARYLREAVASILAQSFRDFELIVIDDGSSDSTKKIADAFAARDPRVRVISRANTGIVGALNEGIATAHGEFLARMDADDRAHPSRFARQLAFLQTHPACLAVGTAAKMIDPAGRFLKTYLPPLEHSAILQEALNGNGAALLHPTVLLRASAARQVGGYVERFRGCEDLDLYLRLAEFGQLANLAEPLLDYRVHHQSYNHNRTERQRDLVLTATNEGRKRHGLPELSALARSVPAQDRVESHLRWAGWALEGKNIGVARLHAVRAFLLAPLQKRTRQFLGYVFRQPSVPSRAAVEHRNPGTAGP